MLDKSAATPVAATRQAYLMGAGRRCDFRKIKSRGSGWTELALVCEAPHSDVEANSPILKQTHILNVAVILANSCRERLTARNALLTFPSLTNRQPLRPLSFTK